MATININRMGLILKKRDMINLRQTSWNHFDLDSPLFIVKTLILIAWTNLYIYIFWVL